MKNLIGMFPGQGSQSVGMGKQLFESNDTSRALFEKADATLGFSLSSLCFDGPIEELTLTKHAQPAILTASYAAYLASGIVPKAAAGHSLGEYSALVAAGVLSFDDAVSLVHKRGTYMQEAVAPGEGKMLAVMGLSEEEILSAIAELENNRTEIANLNCPGQTVVAGSADAIDQFTELLKQKGAKAIPLNVSAPFHCSLMQPAADSLSKDLEATTFNEPSFPIYANVTAGKIANGESARDLLLQQVTGSVRWTDSMQNMIKEQSADSSIEYGAGGVLSKLLKRIDKSLERLDAFDQDSIAKAKATLEA
ncbi:UNVERIFIED_CONTAM: hypothetical protein GTU68_040529 [Idotea baltica]|nr:hypothetical protein [Idotea baltica]